MPTPTKFRPPVVTILGHVDHGKTSLLDRLRSANVAAKEAGGITQAIGAYQIVHQGHTITFIDTPGHAAFAEMRRRGGQVADIAILVIAADDGVMPQTQESIKYIKQAKTPYLVAINKMDAPGADPIKVKTGLSELGEYVEGFGGTIPVVEISAKTGSGIDQLLETLLLMAEMESLTDTSDQSPSIAVVIESSLHPQKGALATLLVKIGTFHTNDNLYESDTAIGKIRTMYDFQGKTINTASVSTPIQILGFSSVPQVGDIISTTPSASASSGSIASLLSIAPNPDLPNVIIKADYAGSLEAICQEIRSKVNVISASVGPVNESDVNMANVNHAIIVGFNSKLIGTIARFAEIEKVEFKNFDIIYQLFDFISEYIEIHKNPPAPIAEAEAKILKIFTPNHQVIYGCRVISGSLKLGQYIQKAQIVSLQVGANKVSEVNTGEECGMIVRPDIDLKPDTVIIAYNQPIAVR